MDDYISKPVRIAELQAALERWGPLKTAQFDSNILLRAKAASAEHLLDQSVVSRLQSPLSNQESNGVRERIEAFLSDTPQRLNELSQNTRDPARLVVQVQTLKAMSSQAGAKRIAELCDRVEEYAKTGSLENVAPILQELRAAFAITRKQLLPLVAPSSLESTP
jgi:hypothetical protein